MCSKKQLFDAFCHFLAFFYSFSAASGSGFALIPASGSQPPRRLSRVESFAQVVFFLAEFSQFFFISFRTTTYKF